MRECWNWQTGKTKDLVGVCSCGFKSHLPHYHGGKPLEEGFLFSRTEENRGGHPSCFLRFPFISGAVQAASPFPRFGRISDHDPEVRINSTFYTVHTHPLLLPPWTSGKRYPDSYFRSPACYDICFR